MEMKCLPSKPDRAEMDMARLAMGAVNADATVPFLVMDWAARRVMGAFMYRREENMMLMDVL